jgi:hypothetical protein
METSIHQLRPATSIALEGANGFLLFRFGAAVAAALGLIGLTLAVVGVYGVISYSGSQRTHEIGIRMAFGAQPGQILKMVLGHGFVIVGMGVLVGVLAVARSRVWLATSCSTSPRWTRSRSSVRRSCWPSSPSRPVTSPRAARWASTRSSPCVMSEQRSRP